MRRKLFVWVGIVLLSLVVAVFGESFAQEAFPTQPVTVLIPFPPGGLSDATVRTYAIAASETLGQPVVPLNKPGAGGTVAVDILADSKPDGYTLLESSASTLAHGMYTRGVKWGPQDFTVILGHSMYNFALVVRADAPWKNFNDWVQYVRENPGFKYGSYGYMTTMHVIMEWIGKRLDLKLVPVQLRGDAAGIQNLLGGHIQAHCFAGGQVALIKAGKLKTLLQVTGEPPDENPESVSRLKSVLPDAPMDIVALPRGIFGPKGIPVGVRSTLHDAFKKATVEDPKFVEMHKMRNMEIKYFSPEELQNALLKAHKGFGELMKELGLEKK